jgi:ABC-type uncharacterized transport system ATPase subunit
MRPQVYVRTPEVHDINGQRSILRRSCSRRRAPSVMAMIEAHGLTKRYGDKLAVDDLTFTVRPGLVTGFLGPNGAGKPTTGL